MPTPIYIQEQSPLTGFLSGMGNALQYYGTSLLERKDRGVKALEDLHYSIMTGGLDPRYPGTVEAQTWAKKLGFDKDKRWQDLVRNAEALMGPKMSQFELNIPKPPAAPPAPGEVLPPPGPAAQLLGMEQAPQAPISQALAPNGPKLGGYGVNMPVPNATFSAKEVTDRRLDEAQARNIDQATKEAEIMLNRQVALLQERQEIAAKEFLNIKDAQDYALLMAKMVPGSQYKIDALGKDRFRVSVYSPNAYATQSAANASNVNERGIQQVVQRASEDRRLGTQAAAAILRMEPKQAEDTLANSGLDPKTLAIMKSIMSSTDKNSKNPRLEWAKAAKAALDVLNQSIDMARNSIGKLMDRSGLYPDPQERELYMPAKVTFEDLTMGVPYEDWIRGVDVPPAAPAAGRGQTVGADGNVVKPGPAPSESPTERINKATSGIIDTLNRANKAAKVPLTKKAIMENVMKMSADFQTQYGLTPGQWAEVVKILDKSIK